MVGDERYLFGSVVGAVVLRDGRIAILDGQSALIRVYSAEGEHVEDWGGRGKGPGELSYPRSILPYRGDSILVSEIAAMGITILDDRGQFGRRMIPRMHETFVSDILDVAEGSATPAHSCCTLRGPLATGAFLLSYPEMMPNRGRGTQRGLVTAAIIPDSGGVAKSVGVFRGGAYQLGMQGSRRSFQFQSWLSMAAGLDGYFAACEGSSGSRANSVRSPMKSRQPTRTSFAKRSWQLRPADGAMANPPRSGFGSCCPRSVSLASPHLCSAPLGLGRQPLGPRQCVGRGQRWAGRRHERVLCLRSGWSALGRRRVAHESLSVSDRSRFRTRDSE